MASIKHKFYTQGQGRVEGGAEGAVAPGPWSSRGPRELQLKKKFNSLALLVTEIQGIF